jgi:hypothetical protein
MAKKVTAKSRPRKAKAAVAAPSKDAGEAREKKASFGKRSMAAGAHTTSRSAPASKSKAPAKTARKSAIGKAASAVSATVSNIAESATSLFRRKAH